MVIFSCLDCPHKAYRISTTGVMVDQLYCTRTNKDIPQGKRSYVQNFCPLKGIEEVGNYDNQEEETHN